jgi:hypothetical protein
MANEVGAVIADRDVHRCTLGDDGPGWGALLNDKAVLVRGANHPPNLAHPQTVSGQFVECCRLAAVLGSQPEQVRHTPILSTVPHVIPRAEPSSDQGNNDEGENYPTHKRTMEPLPASRQVHSHMAA